jgi:uncharacterized protein YndB with AHSA1/START domain
VERMTITREFDAPREIAWKAWTDPKYVMQWWGPKGFSCPTCEIDFRVGGKFLIGMKSPDGQVFYNAGEYHEIVSHEKIVSSMFFADAKGNKVEAAEYGIDHTAIENAYDTVLFEDIGGGKTRLTFIGNETMEEGAKSGQTEGWKQIFDKMAEVVATLKQAA